MIAHAFLALLVVMAAAISDSLWRKIPNRLLLVALFAHSLIWIAVGHDSQGYLVCIAMIAIVVAALVASEGRVRVNELVGMGDIKLLFYIIFFLFPYIKVDLWLLGLSFASGGTLLHRRSRLHESLPLAPLFLVACLVSGTELLELTPSLLHLVGESPHALADFGRITWSIPRWHH